MKIIFSQNIVKNVFYKQKARTKNKIRQYNDKRYKNFIDASTLHIH